MHLTMIIVPMDVHHWLDLFAALLLTGLSLHRLLHVVRSKPFVSVHNARSLVFAGSMLAGMIYFWIRFLKPLIS